ncbi:hypothetical protein [Vibrio sp. ABG19]|uniref:hypothetical protein n=1 Tax=Vibrio sp. ABG19 TaxID=2817385 RepID=UPI00249F85F3|nr:hypothetical protein [Vibrio sp. ABG19]WGY45136.1 hypothetical protein J0X00_05400 [Vibrio sp. ABG19]
MHKLSGEFIKEPILKICNNEIFDSHEYLKDDQVPIYDQDMALKLFYSQSVPSGFVVFQDRIEDEVSKFSLNESYDEAENYINDVTQYRTKIFSDLMVKYRKKKVKKINNKSEDFYFEVIDDLYYIMKMLSIQRYIIGFDENSLLERFYDVICTGYFPCGLTQENKLCVFDFKNIK